MSITIFLADDHPVLIDGLRLLLESQTDLKVIGVADNGLEAVRQVAQCCPQVVIMDITMPEMNGIEAMQEIHTFCPSTRVIILSMHGTTQYILRALQAGAYGFLLKGSASTEVIKAIHTVRMGRRYLSKKISPEMIDNYLHQQQTTNINDPLASLSYREREVLQLVVEGNSSAEIANLLHLSTKTVETYRSRLMHKLNLSDLPSLVKFAIQHGLTPLE